jgi:hypothetical protein
LASYRLGSADLGHRIRVREWASNISGQSAPAVSAPTAIVPPPVAVSRLSLSVAANRTAKLGFSLSTGAGGRPLTAVVVTLPASLTISRGRLSHAIAVYAKAKKVSISAAIRSRQVTVRLRRSRAGVRITIGGGLLTVSRAMTRRVRSHKPVRLKATLVATDTGGARTRLPVEIPMH